MIFRKRKEVFSHNQPEIVPQISTLILIDRSVDLITPLSTQLTYEGLIDEIYGIKNSKLIVCTPVSPVIDGNDTI